MRECQGEDIETGVTSVRAGKGEGMSERRDIDGVKSGRVRKGEGMSEKEGEEYEMRYVRRCRFKTRHRVKSNTSKVRER